MDMQALTAELTAILGPDAVEAGEPMSAHTTFELGGPAELFVQPSSAAQVAAVVRACAEAGVPLRMLGRGSNILASDEGVQGVVCCLAEAFSGMRVEGTSLFAEAGASNEQVAAAAQAAGLAGYEFASGIPGSIGGAAIMNAGAYGGEFKDVCVQVSCVTPAGEEVLVSADEAAWGYRHSMMMDEGYAVTGAWLQLQPDNPDAIQARMDDLRQRREEKQPLELPSAGSTFKRPEGYFAGKLIQDAGLMGYTVGGAQVSTKHAGFVVNFDHATAADVLGVIHGVQQRVLETAGVQLEPEVRIWG